MRIQLYIHSMRMTQQSKFDSFQSPNHKRLQVLSLESISFIICPRSVYPLLVCIAIQFLVKRDAEITYSLGSPQENVCHPKMGYHLQLRRTLTQFETAVRTELRKLFLYKWVVDLY